MKKLLVFLVVLFLGIFITLVITTQAFALPQNEAERIPLPQDIQERINAAVLRFLKNYFQYVV